MRGDLDQHHVVEADAVEAVLQRDHALDLVRLDHRGQHVAHRQRLLARGDGVARQPVGRGEDAAEVVGRMAPFGREPGVVEIEPADHGADVERGLDRVELELRARHLGAVRHNGARARSGPAAWCRPGIRAPRGRSPACPSGIARRVVGFLAVDLVVQDVVGDVDQDLVGLGTDVGNRAAILEFFSDPGSGSDVGYQAERSVHSAASSTSL